MKNYRLTNQAKEDLIRIHHYGIRKFGVKQADMYFDNFFINFELIAKFPYAFESVDYIKPGYRRCVSGVDSIYFRINENITEIITIVGRQEIRNL